MTTNDILRSALKQGQVSEILAKHNLNGSLTKQYLKHKTTTRHISLNKLSNYHSLTLEEFKNKIVKRKSKRKHKVNIKQTDKDIL